MPPKALAVGPAGGVTLSSPASPPLDLEQLIDVFDGYGDNPPARWGAAGGRNGCQGPDAMPAGSRTLAPPFSLFEFTGLAAPVHAATPCTASTPPACLPACSKTKVVATIGPTSCDRDSLFRLADAGMSVVRLNMSHGDHASHKVRASEPPQPAAARQQPRHLDFLHRAGSAPAVALPSSTLPFFPPCAMLCVCWPQAVVDLVREYNALGRGNLALMLDTKGPGELPPHAHGMQGAQPAASAAPALVAARRAALFSTFLCALVKQSGQRTLPTCLAPHATRGHACPCCFACIIPGWCSAPFSCLRRRSALW